MVYFDILTTIGLTSSIVLWEEWNDYSVKPLREYNLHINLVFNTNKKYGLEILGKCYGDTVLKGEKCLLSVNSDWDKATIFLSQDYEKIGASKILNALLFTHLSNRKVIEIHASLIQTVDKGILFLGPSGIGKTTQAELWMQYRGAEIINGDMVFVKREEDRFLGCGSPWHGSSPYCLNKQVPLSALIVLKQSNQNTIRCLKGFEMVSSVMSSVFWPTWYREGYEAACETFDALLNTVPVYELSCRPDEDAVKLTEETIFGK